MDQGEFLGHPKGFWIVAFVELCERFSSLGIASIIILYMGDTIEKGGLGWASAFAFTILGVYRMMSCVTAVPGGIIADRWLGARKSVTVGALACLVGDFILSLPSEAAFFAGLACLAIGGGFYKPNITTVLGRLYKPNDPHKEAAFTVFYLAVNIGSLIAGFAIGLLAKSYGWRSGFMLAGAVLLLGQIVYFFGQRYLRDTDGVLLKKSVESAGTTPKKIPLTPAEKRRIWVILFAFFVVIIFMIAYDQFSGLLPVYIERSTDRMLGSFQVPTPWYTSLNPLIVIIFAPLFAALWTFLGKRKCDPSAMVKMGLGVVVLGLAFSFMIFAVFQRDASSNHLSSMIWIVLVYFFCTIGELLQSPVALSFITSAAPARMTSQIMGWYIAASGVSCFLAAKIGSLAENFGEMKVFTALLVLTAGVGLVQLLFAGKIMRLMEEKE